MLVWGGFPKKLVWGGFPNLPDLPGPICDFFEDFEAGGGSLKTDFSTSRVRKKCSKIDFFKMF